MKEPIIDVPIPEEVGAFIEGARRAVIPTGAGAAAASAVTPFARTAGAALRAIPGAGRAVAPAVEYGLPPAVGGGAAVLSGLAQEEFLPPVSPELMAENPTATLLGQFAGMGPFFRPGLPVNTTGGARVAVPAIAGGIGAGIEGAQQIAEGDLDAQRLAIATLGSALMNRETGLGRTIAPNTVLPNMRTGMAPMELSAVSDAMRSSSQLPATDIAPLELEAASRAMREPTLPAPTDIVPGELAAMGDVSAAAAQDMLAARAAGVSVDDLRVRRLAERMAGKTPDQQLEVLNQEVALAGETLSPVQERAALDLKLGLEDQVAAQKAAEDAAKAQEKAAQEAQRAMADAQKAQADAAMGAAEPPKSTQILMEPVTKPPSVANVATEIATQTENSPYALQAKLNEFTGTEQAAGRPPIETDPTKIAADRTEYDRLQAEMQRIGFDKTDSPEFQAAWQASEDIKNRHGGMPPSGGAAPEVEITLYHGGPKIEGELKEPAFLTTDKQGAQWYANERGGDTPTVSEFTAKIKNPLNIDEAEGVKTIVAAARDAGVPVEITGEIGVSGWEFFSPEIKKHGPYDGGSVADLAYVPKVRAALRKLGYDAIQVSDMLSNDFIETFIVLDPKKLKRVTRGPENALPEQIPNAGVLRPERPELELQAMGEGNISPEIAAGNQVREEALPQPLSEAQFLAAEAPLAPATGGRPAASTRQASRMRQTRGAIAVPGKQTETPEFKKWFGDSKVVDAEGKPLVVYHGTSKPISAFRRKEGGRAIWFTDSSPTAETYAGAPEGIVGANVVPSYVTMKNPMVFDAEGATWDSLSYKGKRVSTDDLAEMAEEAGNDGLIVRNIQDDNDYIQGNPPSDHYAVFKPTQIKSAIGNRGTFDPNNPDIRAAINPAILSPIAGGLGGAGYGITQGETPEERMTNALLYGALGTGAGLATGIGARYALQKPVRSYKSPVLKRVDQMLTPKDAAKPLFEQLHDGYNNLRYRFNTRFAPIGAAQRELFKATNREFTPNKYYDLERGFERLSGAPVQAEGEVELLQNVVDNLTPAESKHLDPYLALERIRDRLLKTDEENALLQDAVGVSAAEYQSALAKAQQSPTERNLVAASLRKKEWETARDNLNRNFNRKRVADWSIADAEKGLADLQAEIGPQAYAKLVQAGQEYQAVMRRALDIQVDSGRMTPELRDQVLASNDFYAPFKVLRHFEEDEPFIRGGGTSRIPSSEQLVKRITGIDDNDVRIGSPTSVAAEQIYKGYILAQKNRKLRELATLSRLDPDGDFVRLMKPEEQPRTGYEAVTYYVAGVPKRMEVARPIAEALTGAGIQETALVMRALGAAGSAFKMGATGLSVPFNVANAAVFDPLRLATISKYGFRGPQDFLYTLYEWPRAFWSSWRGNLGQFIGAPPDALYEQWMRSGAANSTLARAMSPEAFSSRLPLLKKGVKELYGEATYGLGTPIKVASLLSNTLEETTKLLGLQRAIRIERLDKLSPDMRRKKWDEIVTELRNYAGSPDFSRMGADMRALNIVIPFLNPRWQGALADFARINPFRQGNAKDAGAAWARLATLVAIPSAALTVYNLRPENEADFNQIPKEDRERYFHIPFYADPQGKPSIINYNKGGYYFKNRDGVRIRGYFRIPKREVSGLIANTVEDFISYAKATDPKAFDEIAMDFGERLLGTASPVSFQGDTLDERLASAAAGVNPVLRVPTEIAANRNFFTGREIVPKSMQDASPEKQFTEQTPEFYKRLSEKVPDAAPEMMRSPLRLQHGIEGMTGGFARQFAVPRLSEGNPALETLPVLGRFFRSERVENTDLMEGANKALRARADQRLDAQRMAQKIAGELEAATPDQRATLFSRYAQEGAFNDEDTRNYFQEELKDMASGLNYEDRVVKRSYSIAGGHRARYYLDKIAALPAGERNKYFMDQVNKGLLTKEVGQQIAETLAVGPK
jgi:hypothetical protein